MSSSSPCDNAPGAKPAKVLLRTLAMSHVGAGEARVLDAFCGTGQMFDAVWRGAATYAGCDERAWDFTGPARFVCDNTILLRALDLSAFNIFDLDAYGSPWGAAAIIAARRRWLPGERGAVVLTDGSSMRTRFGGKTAGMAASASRTGLAASDESERATLAKWIHDAAVHPMAVHRAHGNGSGRGGQRMTYTAVLFEGH